VDRCAGRQRVRAEVAAERALQARRVACDSATVPDAEILRPGEAAELGAELRELRPVAVIPVRHEVDLSGATVDRLGDAGTLARVRVDERPRADTGRRMFLLIAVPLHLGVPDAERIRCPRVSGGDNQ